MEGRKQRSSMSVPLPAQTLSTSLTNLKKILHFLDPLKVVFLID